VFNRPETKQLIISLILIFAMVPLVAACGDSTVVTVQEPSFRVGSVAPDFELLDYNGKQVKLSDFKGHPVMINFWLIGCPPCQAEMPNIMMAYHKYQSEGLMVIGINAWQDSAAVKKYIETYRYDWKMVLDSGGKTAEAYAVNSYPTSFFVDWEGVVKARQIGGLDLAGLEEKLSKIR